MESEDGRGFHVLNVRSSADGETLSLEIIMREMEELKSHLARINSPVVLCHNDLLTENVIYNQEGAVKFIDYEYADFNYQAYDIGNHFNEFAGIDNVDSSLYPSDELQFDWLSVYLESFKRCSTGDSAVTQTEVQELYEQVCQFSLICQGPIQLLLLEEARVLWIDTSMMLQALCWFCRLCPL
ncbi:ethanolamine kinase 1-like isoform X1 [Danio rerio]|uniref:Ethanolamine kinase 1-like isoform X1 n=3 Tax=Danio rerio TaxID=7955 RepID=A0AC58IHR6_DANRE